MRRAYFFAHSGAPPANGIHLSLDEKQTSFDACGGSMEMSYKCAHAPCVEIGRPLCRSSRIFWAGGKKEASRTY
jgi:hypothetical protein